MSLSTILIIILVLLLIGVVPTWPHSQEWGSTPATVILIAIVVLIVLLVTGRL